MARVQITTSSISKNCQIAGYGKGQGLNKVVYATTAGLGVGNTTAQTDGGGNIIDQSEGYFEVLDAIPAWYLRTMEEEEEGLRLISESDGNIRTNVSHSSYEVDGDVVRNLQMDAHDGVSATTLNSTSFNLLTDQDFDSELASVEIGDSIETASATGVIVNINQTASTVLFNVKLTRGTTFGSNQAIRFAKGALLNPTNSTSDYLNSGPAGNRRFEDI